MSDYDSESDSDSDIDITQHYTKEELKILETLQEAEWIIGSLDSYDEIKDFCDNHKYGYLCEKEYDYQLLKRKAEQVIGNVDGFDMDDYNPPDILIWRPDPVEFWTDLIKVFSYFNGSEYEDWVKSLPAEGKLKCLFNVAWFFVYYRFKDNPDINIPEQRLRMQCSEIAKGYVDSLDDFFEMNDASGVTPEAIPTDFFGYHLPPNEIERSIESAFRNHRMIVAYDYDSSSMQVEVRDRVYLNSKHPEYDRIMDKYPDS